MKEVFTPVSEGDVAEIVQASAKAGTALEIRGGGTKAGYGHPVRSHAQLDVSGLSGINLYEPGALTLVAQAGTPLEEIKHALAAEGQRLAFEPLDYRPIMNTAGKPTIGGTVATNDAGPRRIQGGACRDSLIGVRFVSGDGDVIKNGGRVMKNVTGIDLVKLMCGSHGTLGVLTEVAFKVLPANEREATLVVDGLEIAQAVRAMTAALGSPYEVTGACHLPEHGGAKTALRVEGFSGQVDYRLGKLRDLVGGDNTVLEGVAHDALWERARSLEDLPGTGALWRIGTKPSATPSIADALSRETDARCVLDWGGGLVWAEVQDRAEVVRPLVEALGGVATLVRPGQGASEEIPVFQPLAPRLSAVSRNLRAKFDPSGVLNPGRMAV